MPSEVTGQIETALAFAAIGGIAVLLGGVYVAYRTPSSRTRSLIQHFAAGTIYAGLVIDVWDKIIARHDLLPWVAGGLALAFALMIAIRAWDERTESEGGGSFGVTLVIDVITDGGLIGLSVALGSSTAVVLAGAIAPELFFLGISGVLAFSGGEWSKARKIGFGAAVGAAVVAAGGAGYLLGYTSAGVETLFLSYGAGALTYFIFEELISEAHEEASSWSLSAVFLAAFVAVFLGGLALK